MWIGILVLITFGICAIACVVLSIRGAMQGKWHVFGALLVPAFGIGGTIIMLVARPVTLELVGDSNLEDLPERVSAVVGDDLMAAHIDTVRFGLAYDDQTQLFHWYDESFHEDGGFSGHNAIGRTWSGGWDIVENRLCLSQGQNSYCYGVHQDGDIWYQTNHRNEIVNRYMLMSTAKIPDDRVPLSSAVLAAVVPGRMFSGELQLHFGQPFYSADFSADDGTVVVRRGDDAASLEEEATGTYTIEEKGNLCLTGVLYITDACFEVVSRPGGLDIARDDGRIIATVTDLR